MLCSTLFDRPRRRLADRITGGIGAAFLGHAITRFAVFLTTGHAGDPERAAPSPRRSSAGGTRRRAGGCSGRATADAGPVVHEADGRRRRVPGSARDRPSRSTSTSRSASRSARTATSSSTRGGRRAGRATGSRRSSTALLRRDRAAGGRASTPRSVAGRAGRPLDTVYLGGGRRSLLPPDVDRRDPRAGPRAFRPRAPTPRSRSRPTRGPTSAVTPRAPGRRRDQPPLVRRPVASTRRCCGGSAGGTVPAMSPTPSRARPRGGDPSVTLDLLYDVPGQTEATWAAIARRRARARAGPRLRLRADPRRPRCRGPHGPDRRPPADARGRATLARRRRRSRTTTGRRRSTR